MNKKLWFGWFMGLASLSGIAMGHDVLLCHKIIGTQLNGTLVDANVTETDGPLSAEIERCTGMVRWGCTPGAADYSYEKVPVTSQDHLNFHGSDVAFWQSEGGGYNLVTSHFTEHFDAVQCALIPQ